MRIVLISLHFAEYSMRLAKSLAKNDDVLLILRRENRIAELGDIDTHDLPSRLRVQEIPYYKLKDPRFILNSWRLIRLIRQFQADIIHAQEAPMADMVLALIYLHKIPYILTIHDHVQHSGHDSKIKLRKILCFNYLRKYCSAAIVHGKKIKGETEKIYPYISGRVFSILHGSLGLEVKENDNTTWKRGQLLFFGRVEEYKGLHYLISAIDKLADSQLDLTVIIAGRGNDLDHQRVRIENNPIWEIREGYASAEEVKDLMLSSNIIVMPYIDATQSGVAAMAIGYGRPVIATNVGSIPELVIDGYNGLLIPPKDINALADAIKKLCMDEGLCTRMASNSHELSAGKLSWDVISKETVTVYNKVMGVNNDRQ